LIDIGGSQTFRSDLDMKKFVPNKCPNLQFSINVPEIIDEHGDLCMFEIDIALSINYLFG
jgi:hypothetical protein